MAQNIIIHAGEEKLAAIIWREAPINSTDLVAIADKELSWKKSTTYTVLKKLCEKGVFKNDNATISVLLTRDELIALQSRYYIEDTFGGSLPMFITSFIGNGKLSPEQAAELRRLIDTYEGGNGNG
jgi:predicted transcriptional regulator